MKESIKDYHEIEGYILSDGMSIPMVRGNRDYEAILVEIASGVAVLNMYEGSDKQAVAKVDDSKYSARKWRNDELKGADLDLNREQDGMTSYTVSAIREWRVTLRNWPETDSFPTNKPVKPY